MGTIILKKYKRVKEEFWMSSFSSMTLQNIVGSLYMKNQM